MKLQHVLLAAGLMISAAHANVVGSDYQIFNPTTNGLDFVTVQSSETLSPYVINTGLFLNYAADSLMYSQTLNSTFPAGQKRRDRTLGMDLSVGMGLTKWWDVGVNVPFVLSQTVQDDYYVSSLGHNGATEIKANTKFHLLGDNSHGLAFIFSINDNLVSDNPFAGRNPGLTYNYEVAGDLTIAEKWAVGLNFGFRDRNPGTAIADVPFVPMGDQWIYSVAASYLMSSIDTKMIFEIYGSSPAQKISEDTDRNLSSLEALLGFKHDLSPSLALHFGGGHEIGNSIGGADWRVYAGLNWAVGPIVKTKAEAPVIVAGPVPPAANNSVENEPKEHTLILTFAWDSDAVDSSQLDELKPELEELFAKGLEKVSVEGHTDSVGDPSYNIDLSQRRAKTVFDYLNSHYHLPESAAEYKGLGDASPIADNGNYQGRRQNRRVEIKIVRK